MKYRIYHGSADRIEVPQFGVGTTKNDYGLGFYCTESQDLAKKWAVRRQLPLDFYSGAGGPHGVADKPMKN